MICVFVGINIGIAYTVEIYNIYIEVYDIHKYMLYRALICYNVYMSLSLIRKIRTTP